MSVKIINDGAGIASGGFAEIRKNCREPKTVIFYYHSHLDLIIMNEDHPDFSMWRELLQGYLSLEDHQKKIFREALRRELKNPTRVLDCLSVIDRICRIRRHRKAARA